MEIPTSRFSEVSVVCEFCGWEEPTDTLETAGILARGHLNENGECMSVVIGAEYYEEVAR